MGWEPSKQLLKVTLHEATHLTCSLELSLQFADGIGNLHGISEDRLALLQQWVTRGSLSR